MDVGKGLFRLVQQNQQQRNTHAGGRQGQQQGIDLAIGGESQGVSHAQAHQPGVADEVAHYRTAKHMLAVAGEA